MSVLCSRQSASGCGVGKAGGTESQATDRGKLRAQDADLLQGKAGGVPKALFKNPAIWFGNDLCMRTDGCFSWTTTGESGPFNVRSTGPIPALAAGFPNCRCAAR